MQIKKGGDLSVCCLCHGVTSSLVEWTALAGVSYLIEACAYGNGAGGELHLSLVTVGPANDECANATSIPSLPAAKEQDTLYASIGAGEPWICATASRSEWYKWTAPCSTTVHADTLGSNYDTVLAVFTGSCGSLATLACNDDYAPGQVWSSLGWSAYAGTTYYIEAAAYGSGGTGGHLKLNLSEQAPANDLCGAVEVIPAVPFMTNESTGAATTSGDDPFQTCSSGGSAQNLHSVWYTYQSASDRLVKFDTVGSTYDTVLTVYTGACGSFTEVGCNDDLVGVQSQLTWLALAGVKYTIEVTRWYGAAGSENCLTLHAYGMSPPNDHCSGATPLTGTSGSVFVNVDDAGIDAGEPPPCVSPWGASVWFTYTPAANGTLYVSTKDTTYDTILQVFAGTCDALSLVECNNDSFGAHQQAETAIQVSAGVTYYIQASAYVGPRMGRRGSPLELLPGCAVHDHYASQKLACGIRRHAVRCTHNCRFAGRIVPAKQR